jgi:hypothetical protein
VTIAREGIPFVLGAALLDGAAWTWTELGGGAPAYGAAVLATALHQSGSSSTLALTPAQSCA